MKLSKLELELIRELRLSPISDMEATIKIFETGLVKAMNDVGIDALDDWNCLCAGNILGIIEEMLNDKKGIITPEIVIVP
jgi:hypothetical protein